MMIPRSVYSTLLYIAAPFAMLYLSKRAKKQPEYSEHWDERFGVAHYPPATPGRTRIWIHAVSVGETRATFSLVERILRKWPQVDVLYTHMTPTGREVGKQFGKKFGSRISQVYLPYDTPTAMRKFIRQTQPALCLLMETEVWPNLTYAAKQAELPVVLANARLSQKSLDKGKKVGSLIRDAMSRLTLTLAQSEEDAARLKEAGCREVRVLGNLKFDYEPNPVQVRTGREIRKLSERRVLTFASSREGEEASMLSALKEAKANGRFKDTVFFLIPRHPQRFEEVLELIRKSGFSAEKRSDIRDWKRVLSLSEGPDVVLGDSMGEMAFYYALSDVVLMGGSFGDYGSQSVIEPCAIGEPVIVGPSIYNFKYIIEKAREEGAVLSVQDPEQALQSAEELLSDSDKAALVGAAAAKFAQAQRGATERTIVVIDELMAQKKDTNPNEFNAKKMEKK